MKKYKISRLPKAQNGVGNTRITEGDYVFTERPGSTYRYENGQWLISNSGTKNKFITMKDPEGKRAQTLTSGLSSGKTQMIGQKPQEAPRPAVNMLTLSEPQYQQFKEKSAAERKKQAEATSKWYDKEKEKRAEIAGIKAVAPEQSADATFVDIEHLSPTVGDFNRKQRILDTFKNQLYNQQEYIRNRGYKNTYEYETDPEGLLKDQALAAEAAWKSSGEEHPQAPRSEMDFYNNRNLDYLKGPAGSSQKQPSNATYASGPNDRYYNTSEGTFDRVTGKFEPSVQYYNASPALQSTDWMFALPILGTEAGIGSLYTLGEGAMNALSTEIPGLSGTGLGIPGLGTSGVTVGNALNAGFIGHGLTSLPETGQAWYDAYQSGTGDYRDAIEKTAWNALDFAGAGELKEGAKLLAQDVRALRGAAPTAGRTATTTAQAGNAIFSADDINELARIFGEQSPELARAMEINAEAERAAAQRVAPQASTPSPAEPNQLPPPPEEIYIDPAMTQVTTPEAATSNIEDLRAAYHNSTRPLNSEEINTLANEGVGDPADYFGMGEYNGVPISQLDPWAFDNYIAASGDIYNANAEAMVASANPQQTVSLTPTSNVSSIASRIDNTFRYGALDSPFQLNELTDLYGTGIQSARTTNVYNAEEFANHVAQWEAANNLPEGFVFDSFPEGLADPAFTDDLAAIGIEQAGKTDVELLDEINQLPAEDQQKFFTYFTLRAPKVAVARNAGLSDPVVGPSVAQSAAQNRAAAITPQATTPAATGITPPPYPWEPSGIESRMRQIYTVGAQPTGNAYNTAIDQGTRLFGTNIHAPSPRNIASEDEIERLFEQWQTSNNLPNNFIQSNIPDGLLDPVFQNDLAAFGIDQASYRDIALQSSQAEADRLLSSAISGLDPATKERFLTYMFQRVPKTALGRSQGLLDMPPVGEVMVDATSNAGTRLYRNTPNNLPPAQPANSQFTSAQPQNIPTPTATAPQQATSSTATTQRYTPNNYALNDLSRSVASDSQNALGMTVDDIQKLDMYTYPEKNMREMAIDTAGTSTGKYQYDETYGESKFIKDTTSDRFPKTEKEIDERITAIEEQRDKLKAGIDSGNLPLGLSMSTQEAYRTAQNSLEDLYATKWLRTTYADELAARGLDPTDMRQAVIIHAGNMKALAIPPAEAGGNWRLVGNVDYAGSTHNIQNFPIPNTAEAQELNQLINQNVKNVNSLGERTVDINDIGSSAVNFQFHPPPVLKANGAPLDYYMVNDAGEMVNSSGEVLKSKAVDTQGKTEYFTSDVPEAGTKSKPVTVNPGGTEKVAYPIDANNTWLETYAKSNPDSGLKVVTDAATGQSKVVGSAKDITKAELKNFIETSDAHADTRAALSSDKIDQLVNKQIKQLSDNYNNKYGEGLYRAMGVGFQKGSGKFLTTHQLHVETYLPNPYRYSIFRESSYIPYGSPYHFDNLRFNSQGLDFKGLDPVLKRRRAADFMRSQLGKNNAFQPDAGRMVFYLKDFGGSIYDAGGQFVKNVYNNDVDENIYYAPYKRPGFHSYAQGGEVMHLTPEQIKQYRDAGYVVVDEHDH